MLSRSFSKSGCVGPGTAAEQLTPAGLPQPGSGYGSPALHCVMVSPTRPVFDLPDLRGDEADFRGPTQDARSWVKQPTRSIRVFGAAGHEFDLANPSATPSTTHEGITTPLGSYQESTSMAFSGAGGIALGGGIGRPRLRALRRCRCPTCAGEHCVRRVEADDPRSRRGPFSGSAAGRSILLMTDDLVVVLD